MVSTAGAVTGATVGRTGAIVSDTDATVSVIGRIVPATGATV